MRLPGCLYKSKIFWQFLILMVILIMSGIMRCMQKRMRMLIIVPRDDLFIPKSNQFKMQQNKPNILATSDGFYEIGSIKILF